MNSTITSLLSQLDFGTPTICDNLAIVPLLNSKNGKQNYLTMDEGLTSSMFQIEELEDGAEVNDIRFFNKSEKFALLFEGEELIGAKQNRILNVSVLVKPKTEQTLPVSCVEAGRWHHTHQDRSQQRFRSANRMHYARGRAYENQAVTMSLSERREYRSDQSRVWADIDLKSQRMNARSPSAASDAMYVSAETKIEKFLNAFAHQTGQIGSVFLIDGKVSGVEIFESESTHKNLMPKLVQSYALDAIDTALSQRERGVEAVKDSNGKFEKAARDFAARLQSAMTDRFDGVCAGENYRFKGSQLTGGALVHDDELLHLCAFDLTEEEALEA